MSSPAETAAAEPLFFNPFDPAFRVDPYPTYARFRTEAPYHLTPFDFWLLSRYEDVVAVLRDPRSSSDVRKSRDWAALLEANDGKVPFGETFDAMRPFLFLDPPDHTRLRGLVSKAFTPKVIDGLRPRIQELVDELIDAAVARGTGEMEIVEDLAYPLPVRIISEMLGVPPEDHERFKGWSRELAKSLDPDFGVLPPEVLEQREATASAFRDYFRGLIGERRRRPGPDLLSALIAVEDAGDTLTENELLATLILLLVAGHETTVNLIANAVLALGRNRDQLERLQADPSLVRSAIEEVLRYDPPVQMTGRVALEDMKVGDITVAGGQQCVLLLASANRDPGQFDDPDRFDVGRTDNRHVAFSFGGHFCLGAALARLEGQIAVDTLVRRLPGLMLVTETPDYKENIVLRGVETLAIRY